MRVEVIHQKYPGTIYYCMQPSRLSYRPSSLVLFPLLFLVSITCQSARHEKKLPVMVFLGWKASKLFCSSLRKLLMVVLGVLEGWESQKHREKF